ncbi:MFS transporter [Acinetobacter ursingii]|uniref:MFS transporter n=1 Tax=Acinetobacter ursingii TaxID=108980 RepID=UPI0021CD74D2|nr:MFS transporter [Acinetobacter ursingii]MCU4373456.1 MFS transporter [Acinetobacter ursingii]MDG9861724.1 MFS transporter [Acinetobacter ursingii]MDG9895384.1 MFS transporter [Acinetobacter ursingii]MDG9993797.1 MFS transporter [Acinetobacter ursingii]MDH0008903.1 MFS transporter [Acinetobacter ursingii]
MILFSRTALIDPEIQLSAQRLSTRFSFFGLGFATAAWAPLIPFAQQRLHFNHADFGLLLLCSGLGAMLAMPATGKIVQRIGCRVPIGFALLLLAVLLPSLSLWTSPLMMAITLFLFGTAAGSLGVALNIQAVVVEKNSLKSLMSGFHGMASLGGLAGVLTITALLALSISSVMSAFAVSLLLVIIVFLSVPYNIKAVENTLLEASSKVKKSIRQRLPQPLIILIGIACFIIFMVEGAAMDWSGIYLTQQYGVNTTFAGLAYTFFAIAMTTGRFTGDYLIRYFGEKKLLTYSAICATLGLALVSIAPYWWLVLVGYTLVGTGCSNIVPIMFSRAGRQTVMPSAVALSCVSTMAYTGILVGPAFIGMVSELIGLSTVFMALSGLLLLIVALNRFTYVK